MQKAAFLTAALLMNALLTGVGTAQDHKLNLQEASIQTLITTVGEITGKNFVIDPQVQGTVNVVSNQAMTADQIYELFLSILKVHGYAAVSAGDYIKIVPDTIARQDTIPTVTDSQTRYADDALITQVIEVRHVTAAELVSLLRPLVPQNGYIQAHPSSNLLIVSDRAGNVRRLQRIVERIDTVGEDDIEVIPLQHAAATEIVRMLNTLAQSGGQTPGAPTAIADERTNSVLIAGDPGKRLRMKTIVAHLDTPLEGGDSTQVIGLRYASADSLLPILESVLRSLIGSTPASAEGSTYVQVHAETNSLVISAPPAVFRDLAAIVRQLDVRRQQVMVEAIIAEVADDMAREIGVQWQSGAIDDIKDSGIVGGTNFPTNFGQGTGLLGLGVGANGGLSVLGGLGAGLNLGYLSGTITVGDTEVAQIGALIRALHASAGTNVLSTPSIVTLDHQEAVINVGQEVPFVTGQFTNTGSGNNNSVNPFQTIDRRDVGLTLTVTPHINRGDTVTLDIAQEVSSLSSQAVAVDLITNKREFSTTVMVPDGGILVLGGLIDESVDESVQKVPALGDIPVVGNLFRYRSAQKTKRNLMVFIRPRILRDPASINAITGSRYDYMRARQIEARSQYDGALQPEQLPLLPQLEDYLKDDKSDQE